MARHAVGPEQPAPFLPPRAVQGAEAPLALVSAIAAPTVAEVAAAAMHEREAGGLGLELELLDGVNGGKILEPDGLGVILKGKAIDLDQRPERAEWWDECRRVSVTQAGFCFLAATPSSDR